MDPVSLEVQGGAAWLTLARPPLNVLDLPTIRLAYERLAALPPRADVKAVFVRSALPGVFSAGVDVADHAPERVRETLTSFHAVVRVLHGLPQPTVAMVDGHCLGGGCELALCCDLLLATPRSMFGFPEIDLACFPPVAAVLLPRLAPRAAALVLTGERLDAEAARAAGLVTRVVADVEAAARSEAARLASKSGRALAFARRALREGAEGPFAEALARTERLYLDEVAKSADANEGVRAFLEKRKPRWTDA